MTLACGSKVLRQITIHFDVEAHFLRLDTFVRSAIAAQQAVSAINSACFEGYAPFEVVVLPPEEGSLKQYIGVIFKVGAYGYFAIWALIQAMDSPSVQEISNELLGKTPTEVLIEKIRELKYRESLGEIEENSARASEAIVLIEEFVTKSAQNALEIGRNELLESNISEELKYDLAVAQSELFDAAISDPAVLAIGFDESEDFPIPRREFPARAIRPPKLASDKDVDEKWITSIRTIQVTSPNFDREDQSHRKWKGRDVGGGIILFEVKDEQFWLKFRLHEFDFSEATIIKVHLASKLIDGRVRENIVVRVLEVDGLKLADPLSPDALNAILGSYQELAEIKDQWGLFD